MPKYINFNIVKVLKLSPVIKFGHYMLIRKKKLIFKIKNYNLK